MPLFAKFNKVGKNEEIQTSVESGFELEENLCPHFEETETLLSAQAKNVDKDQMLTSDQDIYTPKCEEYQVSIKILSARQLSGLDIDPSITVKCGNDQKKSTKTKKSSNDPDYEEHFIFEFVQPPAVFFDQIITFEAIHTTRILRRRLLIGSFKIDVGTVYRQPNRMFFHRWALLLDPKDPISGSKGYIKCDIAVFKKGDVVKMPSAGQGENDDIEANILMPEDVGENVVLERDPARYVLSIHQAEGLPSVRQGVMSNMRKALTGSAPIDLVDSYVQVSFAGQSGKTKVKKDTSNPDWSQQIIFTELFPPLVRTMRIHVRDNNGTVIATTFLDLNVIADNSVEGFMPTFGPAWINLYGSYRDDSQITPMNFGLGEGVSYRGRLLLSLRVEVEENLTKKGLQNVQIKPCLPLPKNCTGRKEEFFLFCCLLNASMINKKLAGKPLYFEISIGNHGSELDGFKPMGLPDEKEKTMSQSASRKSLDKNLDEDELAVMEEQRRLLTESKGQGRVWRSRTEAMKPSANDDFFCFLPYNGKKPCMHIYSEWEDQRARMFHVNILKRLTNTFESLLTDVVRLVEMEQFRDAVKRLKFSLDHLSSGCNEYLSFLSSSGTDSALQTPLDKLKIQQRTREFQALCRLISKLRLKMTRSNVVSKLKEAYGYVDKLRTLGQEAQDSIPDVFVWLVSGERRLAYQRFRAADLLFSTSEEQRGEYCGAPRSFFLKVPGVTQDESEDWSIWGHVTAYFWLGPTKEMGTYLDGLPKKFKQLDIQIKNPAKPEYVPPSHILYKVSHAYELRCHLFQGRSLTPADESGLSDPFVRVLFEGDSLQSEICFQTVNPVWDQCLVIPVKPLFGLPTATAKNPPQLVLQIYDHDDVGENEFMGQSEIYPLVKLANERYDAPKFPPTLTWIPAYKGKFRVGEILACFELIQLEPDMRFYPELAFDEVEQRGNGIVPVPKTIRPTLSPYHLAVLFWGVRDLNGAGVASVEKPRIEIEIGNSILSSAVIPSFKKQQNFPDMVKSMDVMLPDDPLYRPPVTIRCLDSRTFGRATLVGSNVINSVDSFMWETPAKPGDKPDVVITIEEDTQKVAYTEGAENPLMNGEVNQGFVDEEVEGEAEKEGFSPSPTDDEFLSPSDSEDEGPGPPSMADLNAFHRIYEDDSESEEEEEDDVASFHPPVKKFDEDLSTIPDNISVRTTSTMKSGKGSLVGSKAPSVAGDQTSTLGVPAGGKFGGSNRSLQAASAPEKKKKLEAIEEEGEESKYAKEDPRFGSSKPLIAAAKKSESGKKEDPRKKKPKQEDTDVKFDWWSKYYASVQDREEEKAKMAKKQKRKRRAKKVKLKARILQGLNRAWNGLWDLKDKLNRKKRKAEEERRKAMEVPTDAVTDAETSQTKALIQRIALYDMELESVADFSGFGDTIRSFKLLRGKKTFSELDERNRLVGKFKGNFGLYPLPIPPAVEASGFFQNLPTPDPVKAIVRVYVIRAVNLHPADTSGKADPYLKVSLGKKKFNDKANRIHNQLSPTFGRIFEFDACFPPDTELSIQVWDWDRFSGDDMLGETTLDLEQRLLSKHRALCGLQRRYDKAGYNHWRDIKRPSQILTSMCKRYNLRGPYYKPGQVFVGDKTFVPPKTSKDAEPLDSENVALYALHNWSDLETGFPLVPEHVETRTLYNPEQPGVDQGNIEVFIDIFPKGGPLPGPPVNVVPRKPKKYDLRVSIWDTKDVILDDSNAITGTDSVDQYIKGYVLGPEIDCQQTDVHYRSLKGDGMFNWRFIYHLEFMDAEEKLVYRTKASFFSLVEHEEKVPPKITLQVWDADTFSADDYLGSMVLDLTKIPRGAKSAKTCSLSMMDPDTGAKTVNLFQLKRMRGWWPFVQYDAEGQGLLAGKADVELQLVTAEDAQSRPVGVGREAPEAMPEPQRPETSFAWYKNPLKMMYYDLWMGLRYKCLMFLLILLGLLFVGMFIYQLPSSVADSLIN